MSVRRLFSGVIRLLGPGDEAVFEQVAPDVFDHPVRADLVSEFLADPRHHIAVAIDDGQVVGFASGVHYVHPDKPAELWIDEVSVSLRHRRRGLARGLLEALLEAGRSLGCTQAWVLTDRSNGQAMALYAAVGGTEAPGDVVMFEVRLDGGEAPEAAAASP